MTRIHVSLLLLVFASAALSEPRQWDTEGVPVRAVSIIEDFSSATRTDGATLVVWAQSRGYYPVVVGQLLSPAGEPLWAEGGLTLGEGERRAGFPLALSVGDEWVILWQDAEIAASSGPERGWNGRGSLRMIRIDDNGNPVWGGGLSGLELAPITDWWDVQPCNLYKSDNGVIATWRDVNAHWAMRITENGQFDWPEPVVIPARHSTRLPAVASDELGGLIFCWSQVLAGDTMVLANRLLQDGTFAWNDSTGVTVYTSNSYFSDVSICPDYAGGAYVVWRHNNDSGDPLAQHLSSQGELQWAAEGIVISDLTYYRDVFRIASSFNMGQPDGLLTITREEDWTSGTRMLVQKLAADGSKPWSENGTEYCWIDSNVGDLPEAKLISDNAGGALCLTEKLNYDDNSGSELLLIRVSSSGEVVWGDECGVGAMPPQPNSDTKFTTPALITDDIQVFALNSNWMRERVIRTQRLDLVTADWEYETPRSIANSDPLGIWEVNMTMLGNGSTASVWRSYRSGVESLQYQIMNVFGEPLFPSEGALLLRDTEGNPLSSSGCVLASDGSGGFFAALRSLENGWYRLRAVHVNGLGQHVSDPAGVMVVDSADWMEAYGVQTVADGIGGCYVVASMFDEQFYLSVVVMRIDAQCNPLWNESVIFSAENQDVHPVRALQGEDNSCIVIYEPWAFNDSQLRGARISEGGDVVWNVEIDGSVHINSYDAADACANSAGGAYVVWTTMDAAEDVYQARMQNISASGEFIWNELNVFYEDSSYDARHPSCDADVVGNLTVAWERYNGTDTDILAQRISPDGVVLWPDSGLVLCAEQGDQHSVTVVTISDNEVYAVWSDYRVVGNPWLWMTNIYATHVNALGQIRDDSYWIAGGNALCAKPYNQAQPRAVADGAGGIVIAWLDERTVTSMEQSVFAQRLFDPIFTGAEEAPGLVTEYLLSQNYPNPFNPTTSIEFALPHSGQTSLIVYDITGREVARLLDEPLEAGPYRVTFNAQAHASGIYFYSLRSADFAETKKMVLLR